MMFVLDTPNISLMFVGWLSRVEEAILQTFKTSYVSDNITSKVIDDNEEVNRVGIYTPRKVKDELLNGVVSAKLKDKPKVVDSNNYRTRVSNYEKLKLRFDNKSHIKIRQNG